MREIRERIERVARDVVATDGKTMADDRALVAWAMLQVADAINEQTRLFGEMLNAGRRAAGTTAEREAEAGASRQAI